MVCSIGRRRRIDVVVVECTKNGEDGVGDEGEVGEGEREEGGMMGWGGRRRGRRTRRRRRGSSSSSSLCCSVSS